MVRATYIVQQLAFLLAVICFTDCYCAHAYTKDTFCYYKGDIANCSGYGHNLTFIPPIRQRTHTLFFNNNYLPHVSNATFINVSTHHIYYLQLRYNKIEQVTTNAFNSFTQLERIDLSGNNVPGRELQIFLGHLSTLRRLWNLELDSLLLEPFPNDLFSYVKNNTLNRVYLLGNNISAVSRSFFMPLNHLDYIDMRKNVLTSFDLPFLHRLKTLHLQYNELPRIPNFCTSNSSELSLVPALRYLYLQSNVIRHISNSVLNCMPKLNVIELGGNYISLFPDYMLSNLPNLYELKLNSLKVRFPSVQRYAFKSTSLTHLDIANGVNTIHLFPYPYETFRHSPNLEYLRCNYVAFNRWTDGEMAEMFSSLVKLETIHLRACKIGFTPIKLFQNMPNLKYIDLALNFIRELSPMTFKANVVLKKLDLDDNVIAHFNQTVLPASLLDNLKMFSSKVNPYACTCDLQWYFNWLETANNGKNITIQYYPEGYQCATPSSLAGTFLSDVSFTYRQCHPWGPTFWIGVIGGPIVVVIIAISAITYRNRWNIKHYIYLFRRRQQYNRLEGRNYLFDAFVAYNESDRQWVIQQLLPELENREGFRLCVHDRDFKPGAYINDNITERMEESRSIMLVLSDDFVTSGWCSFEMKVAHAKHIEDNTDLIVVVLKMPKARNMTKVLKTLLQSTTYIEWTDDDDVGNQLFWNKLKDAMKV